MLATLAVIVVAAGAGTWARVWLATSPRFMVTELSVSGNSKLSSNEVLVAMGLHAGENIFSIDLAELEQTLESHPWISESRVERRLPGRLLIEISEHRATAVVELGGLYLIDEDGVPFKRAAVEQKEGLGLVVITGLTRDEYALSPGDAHKRFRWALRLVNDYHQAKDRPIIGEIHLDQRRRATLFLRESAVAIRIGSGSADELRSRLYAFDAAWNALSLDEQQNAVVVHANRDTTPQRVSVAFSQSR